MSPSDAVPDSILRHRPFMLYWGARTCASLGFMVLGVAVAWQMYALTGSAFDLGLVGLMQFLPMAVFMLVAGQIADRHDRRRMLQICQIVEATVAASLVLASVSGWITKELILTAVFIFGIARAFEAPTQQTLLPSIVPASLFPRAVAASASTMQLATICGPALGGFLYTFGPAVPYTICFVFFVASASLLAFMHVERREPTRTPINLTAFFAGVAYIRHSPIILGVISLDLFAVLLGGTTALLPIFANEIFHTGPEGLGLLRAGPAIGAVAVSAVLANWPLSRHIGRTMFVCVALVRARDHRVRAVEIIYAVDGGARGPGRIGCRQRGDPLHAGSARNARRDARPGERGESRCSPAPPISLAISAPARWRLGSAPFRPCWSAGSESCWWC